MEFLIYLILILAAATIWQIMRVVELSNDLKGNDPNKVTENDNRMNGVLMITFISVMFIWVIWQLFEYGSRTLPRAASEEGQRIDDLMNFNWYIVIAVFFLTNGALFLMAYKYYGRDKSKSAYITHNNKLEMLWTGVPAVVLAVIIFWGITLWNDVTQSEISKDVRRVEVYSKQFNWVARYSGADKELGKASFRYISATNELGLDSTDQHAQDDIVVGELYLPVNEDVNLVFRSQDVIHSAFLPHFRAQMNTVPGMQTNFKFKPTITTADMRKDPDVVGHIAEVNAIRKAKGEKPIVFDYWLLCNKICGASHWNMKMKVVIVSRKEYDIWLAGQKTFGGAKTAPVTAEASGKEKTDTIK
ncbi:MAG: cytochrome c oxidase subunit II [Bacteroidetes bacterium]|nr:MAG: cytochrome c oxidase subunit II [Bacteroidota bacterium]